jgi:site-specific DNA-methyltransferase (adenine-specific)
MSSYELITADLRDYLSGLLENSIDSIVTDPPYEIAMMGKSWDKTGVAFDSKTWGACLRVLKPGGYLLSFAGARTYHRIACAIEDAGFEIRDQIMWVYGSGMPKSLNVSKSIEAKLLLGKTRTEDLRKLRMGDEYTPSGRGRVNYDHGNGSVMGASGDEFFPTTDEAQQWKGWGTSLKPAHEPIVVARKPFKGTVAENVIQYGTGGFNIDGCRVGWPGGRVPQIGTPEWGGPNKTLSAAPTVGGRTVERAPPSDLGRWPANLIHDGSDEVIGYFPDAKGQQGKVSGDEPSGKTNRVYGDYANRAPSTPRIETDTSAARFFYCAKASKKDRGEGNSHPTVKPTELMRYLCRLVTQPNGTVLDPFMGSGSTGKAALLEGFRFVGIDSDPAYVEIAQGRLADFSPL